MGNIHERTLKIESLVNQINMILSDVRLGDEDRRELVDHVVNLIFTLGPVEQAFHDAWVEIHGKQESVMKRESIPRRKVMRFKTFNENRRRLAS